MSPTAPQKELFAHPAPTPGTVFVNDRVCVETEQGQRVLYRGISVVSPARLTRSSASAIAHVQAILADGNPIGLGASVHIPGGHRRIVFGFAGLSLSVPERVRFRYLLEGFDHGWSEPAAAREAVYTNLAPGPYRFRVVASNSDGVWSSDEAAIGFDVDPLFWQTWWFRLCIVLIIGFAVAMFFRFRVLRLTKQMNMRFEERLAERKRIAQEPHDTLLQGFLSASVQLHVVSDRLASDSPEKPLVGRVLELMGHVIEEGRNAVRVSGHRGCVPRISNRHFRKFGKNSRCILKLGFALSLRVPRGHCAPSSAMKSIL
jgi:signal transduction histidine kinase